MHARTIVVAAILGVLTFAPRCATPARRQAMEAPAYAQMESVPQETMEAAEVPPDPHEAMEPAEAPVIPQAPVIPSEARDLSLVAEAPPRREKESAAPDGGQAMFLETVRPVLSAKCGHCHDPGGKMHARLPFDDANVVSSHSAAILRRLKGDDRAALEKWLEALAPAAGQR